MLKINVSGEIDQFDFNAKKLIKKVVKTTLKHLGLKRKHEINFFLTDLKTIHQYNLEYRKIDRPTDVISFANIDLSLDRVLPYELGDILICNEKVFEQAKEYGHSNLREFAFLVTHGTLHLLGYDHMTKDEEKVMFNLQDEILNKLNITRE